jgi:hypothetical protein
MSFTRHDRRRDAPWADRLPTRCDDESRANNFRIADLYGDNASNHSNRVGCEQLERFPAAALLRVSVSARAVLIARPAVRHTGVV